MKIANIFRNKKVLVHTVVLVVFLLYLIFLAAPVFNLLSSKPTTFQSQAQDITLPPEKNNIIHVFERLGIENSRLFVIGFTFIYGQPTYTNDKTYIVLQSTENTYVFSTAQIPRYSITHPDGLDLDISNSGIIADVPISVLNPGTYKLGIYIHKINGDIASLKYTDKLIIKEHTAVTIAASTSALAYIEVPPESQAMHCGTNLTRLVVNEQREIIEVAGWAFNEGVPTENSSTYFVLTSDNTSYVFETAKTYTWWLNKDYKILNMDLDYAGFLVRIPRDMVDDGEYKIGLITKDARSSNCQYIGRVLIGGTETCKFSLDADRISTQVDMAIPSESNDLHFHIDIWRDAASKQREIIESAGWAFVSGQPPEKCKTYMVFTSFDRSYCFEADKKYAWWVTDQFKDEDLDLDYAGFIIRVPRDVIAPGKYRVGLLIKGESTNFQYIGATQVIAGEKCTLDTAADR